MSLEIWNLQKNCNLVYFMTASTISNHRIGAWQRRKYIFTNHDWMNQSFNYEAVCRTAPASPGLLIILEFNHYLYKSLDVQPLRDFLELSLAANQKNINMWLIVWTNTIMNKLVHLLTKYIEVDKKRQYKYKYIQSIHFFKRCFQIPIWIFTTHSLGF